MLTIEISSLAVSGNARIEFGFDHGTVFRECESTRCGREPRRDCSLRKALECRVVERIVPPYLVFFQSFAHRPSWFFVESWSLCVEEWFYIFFPLALWAGLVLGQRCVRAFWVTVAAMMLVSLSLRIAAPPPKDWGMDIGMVVVYKFDALAWGAMAAAALRMWPRFWARFRRPSRRRRAADRHTRAAA